MKKELTKGRDFATYGSLMDAAIEQKLCDIRPWLIQGLIVDAGFGSGLLLKRLAEEFPHSNFTGVDTSAYFFKVARHALKNSKNAKIFRGDVVAKHFSDGSISTKIFATTLHEVYSYNGYSKRFVKRALKNTFQELKDGGRVIIRDGIKPEHVIYYVWLRDDDGTNKSSKKLELLSTKALFERFATEFRNGRYARYHKMNNGLYRMNSSTLYEFLSKKDYRKNWAQEIREHFGYITLNEYKELLKELGFNIIHATQYTNPWIEKNWWRGSAKIYVKNKNGKLIQQKFPATTAVLVAERPKSKSHN